MNKETRKLVEDRITIKATQKLRRHITIKELSLFFARHTRDVDKAYNNHITEIDNILNKYLEGLKNENIIT